MIWVTQMFQLQQAEINEGFANTLSRVAKWSAELIRRGDNLFFTHLVRQSHRGQVTKTWVGIGMASRLLSEVRYQESFLSSSVAR